MTAHDSRIYEEIYKDRLIEIYEFFSAAGGGYSSQHFFARIDGYQLSETFDYVSDFGGIYTEPPKPEESEALAAARAYCDREAKALEDETTV